MSKTGRCFFSLLLCALPAWAEFAFFQSVDKTTVGLEETFQLHVVVTNPPANAQVELPSSPDFEVLSRSQSSQLQYGTGRKPQTEQHYVLVLRAKKEGQLLLPPALLKTGNNTHKTQALTLRVLRGHTAPSPSAQGSASRSTPPIPRADSDLFLQTTLDKPSAYVGEQVVLSLLLYSRTANVSLESIAMPTLKGFWGEEFELSWPLRSERMAVDGVHYHVTTLKKRALFALQPGTFTLEPATADFVMGQLFRGRAVHRASNALTLEVKALPEFAENLPAGLWSLELQAPEGPLRVGEPAELHLTLRGTGNIRNVPSLEWPFPDAFKTFQPTVQNHVQALGSQLQGSRTMHFVVIPQEAGSFVVPAVRFEYFNVETQQAQSTQTSPLTWVVLPAHADSASGNKASAPTAVPLEAAEQEKLHPIRHRAQLAPASSFVHNSAFGWLLALPLSLRFLGMLLWLLFSKMGSSAKRQQRRREKAAVDEVCASVGELKTNPGAAAFSKLGKNMLAFLECKLGCSTQGLTQEQLKAKMEAVGFAEPLCKQVLCILGECDAAQFGHGPPDAPAMERVCEATLHVLKEWP